jgi:uncharacterized SAM-binding protein YcdF (DUF218 family)
MKKYDAIIIVPDEGYTADIYSTAVKIYEDLIKKGSLPIIIVSGATREPQKMKSYGLKKILEKFFKIIPVQEQIEGMKSRGIPPEDILQESQSGNTRENAMSSFEIFVQFNFQAEIVYLVGSAEVMLRKYLTFKKARNYFGLNVKIKAVPVFNSLPLKLLIVRLLLIPGEFWRIIKYHKLGHI